MAAIKLHFVNIAGVDHKRRYPGISEAAAGRIFDAYREGTETDAQVWARLGDEFVEQLLSKAHAKRKATLTATALTGVVKDTAVGEEDVA